jgi:hypothetical protein
MAKLLKIFVASVGGGMALGWGARALKHAGERQLAAADLGSLPDRPTPALERRLSQMEHRLRQIEVPGSSFGRSPETSLDSALQSAEKKLSTAASTLRLTVEREVREHLQTEAVSAVEHALAGSLGQRLEQLETTVETHESRMQELRDCSLRTEQNLQKLMAGIERLVSAQTRPPVVDHKEARAVLEKVPA